MSSEITVYDMNIDLQCHCLVIYLYNRQCMTASVLSFRTNVLWFLSETLVAVAIDESYASCRNIGIFENI